jgi:hypothetical protein
MSGAVTSLGIALLMLGIIAAGLLGVHLTLRRRMPR